jgi:hypothetical protein
MEWRKMGLDDIVHLIMDYSNLINHDHDLKRSIPNFQIWKVTN